MGRDSLNFYGAGEGIFRRQNSMPAKRRRIRRRQTPKIGGRRKTLLKKKRAVFTALKKFMERAKGFKPSTSTLAR